MDVGSALPILTDLFAAFVLDVGAPPNLLLPQRLPREIVAPEGHQLLYDPIESSKTIETALVRGIAEEASFKPLNCF